MNKKCLQHLCYYKKNLFILEFSSEFLRCFKNIKIGQELVSVFYQSNLSIKNLFIFFCCEFIS